LRNNKSARLLIKLLFPSISLSLNLNKSLFRFEKNIGRLNLSMWCRLAMIFIERESDLSEIRLLTVYHHVTVVITWYYLGHCHSQLQVVDIDNNSVQGCRQPAKRCTIGWGGILLWGFLSYARCVKHIYW
jgi:hypothetical protein